MKWGNDQSNTPDDEDPWKDKDQWPEPTRTPTTREKFSVLLPALIAFGGAILMLVIFLILAAIRS